MRGAKQHRLRFQRQAGFAVRKHALDDVTRLVASSRTLTCWGGVPDVRGLFYHVCLEVAARRNVHVTTVRLTPHPMPVEGLVVDQSPQPPAKLQRHGELTIFVWHPPARAT